MLFFPYRFDLTLHRLPFLTILISLLCIVIYLQQYNSEQKYIAQTVAYCEQDRSAINHIVMNKTFGGASVQHCAKFLAKLTFAENPDVLLDEYSQNSKKIVGLSDVDSEKYVRKVLAEEFATYQRNVSTPKTKQLWYYPHSWDKMTMLTANFAHGSWEHLVGNLLFFFAFASAVELIVGSISFAAVVLAMSFGTSVAYSLAMTNFPEALPTVGLSGVVMGMMALLAYLIPTGRIRCFWWIIIRFGTIALPAWLLSLWYIGLDVFVLTTQEELGTVNLVAHISGAFIGLVLGMTLLRGRKRAAQDMLEW